MTPLHLEILIKYYSHGEPEKCITSATHKDYLRHLIECGLIYPEENRATDKGEFWLKHILNTPLPEITFIIPNKAEAKNDK